MHSTPKDPHTSYGQYHPTPTPAFTTYPSPANSEGNEAVALAITHLADAQKKTVKIEENRKMLDSIAIFDGTNKSECITWLKQVEAAAKLSGVSLKSVIQQKVAPVIYGVLSDIDDDTPDQDIKRLLLENYSDVSNPMEASMKLSQLRMKPDDAMMNHIGQFSTIHEAAYGIKPQDQIQKSVITQFIQSLDYWTKDKLARKLARNDEDITTLRDAMNLALKHHREAKLYEAIKGENATDTPDIISTSINELNESLPDVDINYINGRGNSRQFNSTMKPQFNRSYSPRSSSTGSWNNSRNWYNGGNNHHHNGSNGFQKNGNGDFQRDSRQQNRRKWQKFRYNHSSGKDIKKIVFEYTCNTPDELLTATRNYVDYLKQNPGNRHSFKAAKLMPRVEKEVNVNEIHLTSIESISNELHEEPELVFDALVAADYINEEA